MLPIITIGNTNAVCAVKGNMHLDSGFHKSNWWQKRQKRIAYGVVYIGGLPFTLNQYNNFCY
jgi:hypothetical protein